MLGGETGGGIEPVSYLSVVGVVNSVIITNGIHEDTRVTVKSCSSMRCLGTGE